MNNNYYFLFRNNFGLFMPQSRFMCRYFTMQGMGDCLDKQAHDL